MKIKFVVLILAWISSVGFDSPHGLTVKNECKDVIVLEDLIYILDTTNITDPVLLEFEEADGSSRDILLSERELDSINYFPDMKFQNFILNHGYLFYSPGTFVDILEVVATKRELTNREKILMMDLKTFRNKESPSVSLDSKRRKGFKCHKVFTHKFIFVLIRDSFADDRGGEESIRLNFTHNIYFRALVPIMW